MKYLYQIKRSRGFTLVELVITIAVIGLLAAVLIPTLASNIDDPRRTTNETNCRQLLVAAKVVVAEMYIDTPLEDTEKGIEAKAEEFITNCFIFAEMDINGEIPPKNFVQFTVNYVGNVRKIVYTNGLYTTTFEEGVFTMEKGALIDSNSVTLM